MPRGGLIAVLVTVAVAPACAPSPSTDRLPLHDGWEFHQMGQEAWRPATVPGTVHTDLLASGVIEDPFWRDNELHQQWIEEQDWHYRTTFRLPAAMDRAEHVELVFEGLDTYAEVRFNDVEILRADNMFRRWVVDVTDLVRRGDNTVDIVFRSPVAAAQPELDALGYGLPVHNEPTRPFARKAAYHYGWDWGPRFATAGIWRPIELRAWSGVRIADLHVVQRSLGDERAELTVLVEIESGGAQEASVTVRSPDGEFRPVRQLADLRPGLDTVALDLTIPRPQRWWPNGLGAQPLYGVVAQVSAGGLSDRAHRRVGLRTVEVVTEPDSVGESFFVAVNGRPVFMKGANYIPADHFTPRAGESRYREVLGAAAAANMNMLRVWGGGVYEADAFYDVADELGILIWQDFMFANAMFPGDSAFLAGVAAEARDQVRRLRNHPSLALWCGNNEIDEAWHNWGWQRTYDAPQRGRIWSAYEAIFHQLLPQTVAQHDSGRFYWPSSPSVGWGHAESLTRGDSHYWGVWHGREPFEVLLQKLPRFASEFGFQGYPAPETVEAFTLPDDRDVESPVMNLHQKHATGLETVREYMGRWYRDPKDFTSFLIVSQLLQAEGMALAFEAQRRAMPRTMGTLYWQLNDTWPVASWSSLDYYGRWKALHYHARDAFAPVLVSPVVQEGEVQVYVVSDRPEPLRGELELRLMRFDGAERWGSRVEAAVPANTSLLAFSEPLLDVLDGADPTRVVLEVRLLEGGEPVADNLLYFAPPKDLDLPDVTVTVEHVRDGGDQSVRLTSDALAKDVYLTVPGADVFFGDNFFDLLPGRVKVLRVREEVVELETRLRVRTLRDTY
jgi:beta-mannosidase